MEFMTDHLAPAIQLNNLSKVFSTKRGTTPALVDIQLTIQPGEFVCLVGPSGCGKSTLFNLIAGLDKPTSGTITTHGQVGLMFQEAALFPWLNVTQNIGFGLKIRKTPTATQAEKIQRYLDKIQLQQFAQNYPHELSGGMRQRVALARTLILEPEIMLMDEPFSALDAQTRETLHEQLQQLWQETKTTIVFVTHDIREACFLGGRIVALSARPGKIKEIITNDIPRPRDYFDPALEVLSKRVKQVLAQSV